MFGGFAPPQISEEEMRLAEAEAGFTVQSSVVAAVILYLSPFAIDAVKGLF
ncbi:uncharacterized protein DNG_03079 [Cephalotrichum gorgonifer]|uniref:Mitochondrial outer membrane translocase complex, subunit Tom5 n=1 Tax=Cephalotrichum gorgonifer TaxID=2041049 RepID=A0AAE8MVK3_9PEZI|nr:uncharacterized protein DNG_03079 [Cephalotrichum gorgonifer]